MKIFKILLAVVVGFSVGIVFHRFTTRSSSNREAREVAALRASLGEAKQEAAKALLARGGMKDEADQLRADAAEVHRLRAEVSRMKIELTESHNALERLDRTPKKSQATPEVALKAKQTERNGILFESAPAAVQTTLLRELGRRPATGFLASTPDKNGAAQFTFKGQTADRRGVAVRMTEDGSVLERSIEIAADAVPPQIQAPASEVFGNLPIGSAREVVEGENVHYELSAKGPDRWIQATVSNDGTILGYSAKRQLERAAPKEKR